MLYSRAFPHSLCSLPHVESFDVLILGSGLTSLSLALRLADRLRVAVITKRGLSDGASSRAQGGIAAALDNDDSIEEHVRDTLVAGAGLCQPARNTLCGRARRAESRLG